MSQKVYVSGRFSDDTINIYGKNNSNLSKPAIVLANSQPTYHNSCGYLAQYETDGTVNWALQLGVDRNKRDYDYDFAYGVSADFSNNVFVVGYFWDESFDIYNPTLSSNTSGSVPNIGLTINNPSGTSQNSCGYIFKVDSRGYAQWGAQVGGTTRNIDDYQNTDTFNTDTDKNNNVYVCGNFSDDVCNIYSGIARGNTSGISNTYLTLNSTYTGTVPGGNVKGSNAFLAKYNSSGDIKWGAKIGRSPPPQCDNDCS